MTSTRCIREIRRRGCAITLHRFKSSASSARISWPFVDGMEMDVPQDIRAPDLATLDLYCDRVASAVGRLSVRVFGLAQDDGILLAHHLGRALQLTNILRDIDEDPASAGCICRARACCMPGITSADPLKVIADPRCRKCARRWLRGRGRISKRPTKSGPAIRDAWCARPASVEILSRDPRIAGRPRVRGAAQAGSRQQMPASPF